jgi:uncharacterized protein YjiS (DUF1127 family)
METAMFDFLARPFRISAERVSHIHAQRTLAALDEALLRDIGVERPRRRHQTTTRMMLG